MSAIDRAEKETRTFQRVGRQTSDQLITELKIARAALEFYAGAAAWKLGHDNFIEPSNQLLLDCGDRAKEALK